MKLWNSEGTPTDIVKDSVVVAYVLELDGTFYSSLATALRARFEPQPGVAVAPGRHGGFGGYALEAGKLLVTLVDVWFMADVFYFLQKLSVDEQGRGTFFSSGFDTKRDFLRYATLRATAYSLSLGSMIMLSPDHNKGLLGVLTKRRTSLERMAIKALLVTVNCGVLVACAPVGWEVVKGLIEKYGFTEFTDLPKDSALLACMDNFHKTAACVNLA